MTIISSALDYREAARRRLPRFLFDYIDGGAGDDLIFGLGGADEIHGGDGNDRIAGGAGNEDRPFHHIYRLTARPATKGRDKTVF